VAGYALHLLDTPSHEFPDQLKQHSADRRVGWPTERKSEEGWRPSHHNVDPDSVVRMYNPPKG
jgi:hypothetical protein